MTVAPTAADAKHEPRVVLVVEDDPSVRDGLQESLARPGREVLVSPDGRDAQEALAAGAQPRVILLDWNMPRVDGDTFLRWRADRAALRDVPVVVMTAAPDVADSLARTRCCASPRRSHAFDRAWGVRPALLAPRGVPVPRSAARRVTNEIAVQCL